MLITNEHISSCMLVCCLTRMYTYTCVDPSLSRDFERRGVASCTQHRGSGMGQLGERVGGCRGGREIWRQSVAGGSAQTVAWR